MLVSRRPGRACRARAGRTRRACCSAGCRCPGRHARAASRSRRQRRGVAVARRRREMCVVPRAVGGSSARPPADARERRAEARLAEQPLAQAAAVERRRRPRRARACLLAHDLDEPAIAAALPGGPLRQPVEQREPVARSGARPTTAAGSRGTRGPRNAHANRAPPDRRGTRRDRPRVIVPPPSRDVLRRARRAELAAVERAARRARRAARACRRGRA